VKTPNSSIIACTDDDDDDDDNDNNNNNTNTINSNNRTAAILFSLETLFVSGICV
jgi:hypothetical protein